MSDLSQVITFASQLYRQRAGVRYAGYVRQDPMALLELRPGRVNPYPVYARLRAAGPLTRTRLGHWVTPSHRVCDAVLRDRRFGVRLDLKKASPDEASTYETSTYETSTYETSTYETSTEDPADASQQADLSFLGLNPPDHTRLRRLALPAFSPKAVATYQARIERTVGDLLDRASADGQFDLVSGFAAPLPIAVITDLLGIPDSHSADFARYGVVIGSALDGVKSLRHARQLMANQQELVQLFEYLFELRRREPRDDIVSHLVAAEGDRITPDEMLSMCILLLVAGFETTVNLISNAVLALLGHPAQWEALGADPGPLAALAVEEPEAPHLAFSSGIHYCSDSRWRSWRPRWPSASWPRGCPAWPAAAT